MQRIDAYSITRFVNHLAVYTDERRVGELFRLPDESLNDIRRVRQFFMINLRRGLDRAGSQRFRSSQQFQRFWLLLLPEHI
ncbi:hypothetical protein POVCU1_041070 [Plasmodium ovale curtisi]|uniref:Uncharacterized protein n=1 Tax=Plasmodium ovale curtisi TaxID=864141 RepID=A0A1A8WXV5_PLAOA|nr:hypothetical protein POVCU1_041070 [Plasmodium ovale curtisi]